MKIVYVLLLIFFQLGFVQANDSPAAPMPLHSAPIAIQSEKIIITGEHINSNQQDGAWHYSCEYRFRNRSNRLSPVKLGFPFQVKEPEGKILIPKGYQRKVGEPLVYAFNVTVEGKPVAIRRYLIPAAEQEKMEYAGAYIWEMKFLPHEVLHVQQNYVVGETFNALGQIRVSYLLETSELWNNKKIPSVHVQVIPNTPTRLCYELDNKSPAPRLPGVQIIGEKSQRQYLWELHQFDPINNLNLCLQTGRSYIRSRVVDIIVQRNDRIRLNELSVKQLRFLKNAIYAQYGKKFKDPELQNHFNKQWWYEINPDYSKDLLTGDDRMAMSIIADVEKRRRLSHVEPAR